MKNVILIATLLTILTSCAVVPKESVELSATVGRDVAVAYKSHKAFATILFTRMKQDVNSFVDDVYAPYQIGKLLEMDFADANSGAYESMTGSIIDAAKNSSDPKKQKKAIGFMKDFVSVVYLEVEYYRDSLLAPVEKQELDAMAVIDRTYTQIIYANSIVTGHLASVRKVHDAQEEILNEFGVENLRTETAKKLSEYSIGVGKILKDAEKLDVDDIEKQMNEVKTQFDNLFKK